MGIDIQVLQFEYLNSQSENERINAVNAVLEERKRLQRNQWSAFIIIKNPDSSMNEIMESVDTGSVDLNKRDQGGLSFAHLAAAYDRADVLQWLVMSEGLLLESLDAQKRTVLDVAKACGADSSLEWIRQYQAHQTISSFISRHFHRKLASHRFSCKVQSVTLLQSTARGFLARNQFCAILLSRIENLNHFDAVWGAALNAVRTAKTSTSPQFSWYSMKETLFDVRGSCGLEDMELAETALQNESVVMKEILENTDVNSFVEESEVPQANNPSPTPEIHPNPHSKQHTRNETFKVLFTKEVVKWLDHGDPKYRRFFVRRMKQLAVGDRSRILAKRLKGCRSVIYETYLEQKSGFRILWTQVDSDRIIIWFIAAHKQVTRLSLLIDDAERRSHSKLVPASSVVDLADLDHDGHCSLAHIRLDPFGSNTPLHLYELESVDGDELLNIEWKPRDHLTSEERNVVEATGNVLLLGRSGSGKTSCIYNCMDKDRMEAPYPEFSQLFVARSSNLCDYVEKRVNYDEGDTCVFVTFERLLNSLELKLRPLGDHEVFLPNQHIDYIMFREKVYTKRMARSCGLDALVVWSCIRSFIKGSIEALQNPSGVVSRSQFAEVGGQFGKRRCRLSQDQRNTVYDAFETYARYIEESQLWDDCDRVKHLILLIQEAKDSSPDLFDRIRHDKLYADEIQDFTQAEILLFFYIGSGNFLLAGDPAQSVVEGSHFRFEDIRSVAYFVVGESSREKIPEKPMMLTVNFRSHSGILYVAAAVLDCLFTAYPDSIKDMMKDRPVFQGPRPGVLHKLRVDVLRQALKKGLNGAWLLTHDDRVEYWKSILEYPLIHGIRMSKGLEYSKVLVLDFFGSLQQEFQKPWRDLLLHRDTSNFPNQHPEIEGHLKLLYTAITRCKEQLYFVETSPSKAGDAFIRFLTTTSVPFPNGQREQALAEKCVVEKMDIALTPDQWRAEGLDNAIRAEQENDVGVARDWLDKALFCFGQVQQDPFLFGRKARAHRSSIQFRSKLMVLEDTLSASEKAHFEMEAAQIMVCLCKENLLKEALILGRTVFPLLSTYSQEKLSQLLLQKLQNLIDAGPATS